MCINFFQHNCFFFLFHFSSYSSFLLCRQKTIYFNGTGFLQTEPLQRECLVEYIGLWSGHHSLDLWFVCSFILLIHTQVVYNALTIPCINQVSTPLVCRVWLEEVRKIKSNRFHSPEARWLVLYMDVIWWQWSKERSEKSVLYTYYISCVLRCIVYINYGNGEMAFL